MVDSLAYDDHRRLHVSGALRPHCHATEKSPRGKGASSSQDGSAKMR